MDDRRRHAFGHLVEQEGQIGIGVDKPEIAAIEHFDHQLSFAQFEEFRVFAPIAALDRAHLRLTAGRF